MYINFSERFILNIDSIDVQHRKWIEIYNEMYKIMIDDQTLNKRGKIESTLKEMHEYTDYHFRSEEKLFKLINYPKSLEHKDSHKKMYDSIYKYYRKILDNNEVSERQVFALLKEWILDHILTEDKEFADYIIENNIDLKNFLLDSPV